VKDVGPNTCDDHKWHDKGKQQAAEDTVTQSNLDRSNASPTPREDKEANEKQPSTRTREIGRIHRGHKIDVWHPGLASLAQQGADGLLCQNTFVRDPPIPYMDARDAIDRSQKLCSGAGWPRGRVRLASLSEVSQREERLTMAPPLT
jgi:hypothetical protein